MGAAAERQKNMQLTKLRVLIIDDDVYKAHDIQKALEFSGVRDFVLVWDQESAWEEIDRAAQTGRNFGLIVTDMHYPVKRGEEADFRAGVILIEEMQNRGLRIPVILCSSHNYRIPGALGCVWYSNLNENMEFDFQELLQKL